MMAKSKLTDPNLANFPTVYIIHSYIQERREEYTEFNLA